MKIAIKAMMAGVVACALSTPALAYTANGVIPTGRKMVVVRLIKPAVPGVWWFRFSAPPVNAGVPYALTYCIGPRANPCNAPGSQVFHVTEGQSQFATVPQATFLTKVLAVGQGTKVPVPYSVEYF
jgi:hypothetical protein